jgi:hypothetical protein
METIKLVPLHENLDFSMIKSSKIKREWLSPSGHRCLPLTFANQHGFVIHSPFDFHAEWDGRMDENSKVTLGVDSRGVDLKTMPFVLSSSFGQGILSLYPYFVVKTPPNVSTWVKAIPNSPKHGVTWLEGVVETDNLDSTFSFNLKLTEPNKRIYFKKGEPLACFVPYPRGFIDNYAVEISADESEIARIRSAQHAFQEGRKEEIEKKSSKAMYRKGKNFNGCPFSNSHQIKLGGK